MPLEHASLPQALALNGTQEGVLPQLGASWVEDSGSRLVNHQTFTAVPENEDNHRLDSDSSFHRKMDGKPTSVIIGMTYFNP